MTDCIKCGILAIIVLFPMWLMANELDGDEFAKSGIGIMAGAIAMGAWKAIETNWNKGQK